ncbi:DUF1080 domain-containing protein [Reichenbachiella sp. MALMAid0571]|uniref:3-keto-disaccharide hydrolase n=1 Tax=Reichenbachiella sp. MALMAid0571 TaxID=3143939 RepID=UPI0032DE2F55
MNKLIKTIFTLVLCGLLSCSERVSEIVDTQKTDPIKVLPFKILSLDDLSGFKPVAKNWKIVGDTYVDQKQKRVFVSSPGTGILLNEPEQGMKENLFTAFEHGDIELELDVMMPVHSNSGLYFQGRYEIQLLDSWGVAEAKSSDIGGIYQRWDESRGKGNERFEGYAPSMNAAKAPGLWQHFKIIFHAPKFDSSGKKIKNAWFEEVWLNGALLHQNQEVSGPTRASAFQDEKPMGPLMIQGDHAAVAIRNIKYKLYEDKKIAFKNLTMKEYENKSQLIPDLDTLVVVREIKTDSISSTMATGENPQKLLVYNGKMNIPNSGDYIFDMKVHRGGGVLIIDSDTIVNLNGDFEVNAPGFGLASLQKGDVPFTLIYNKHRPYQRGLALFVEGPEIAKYAIHAKGSITINQGSLPEMIVSASDEAVMQRSFLMHGDTKRTHCISVATPQGINYSYDVSFGSLLQAWSGGFLNVAKMWHSRGGQQLAEPIGLPVSIHGNPDFAYLENEKSNWPDSISTSYHQLGYELSQDGTPVFLMEVDGGLIKNEFIPSDTLRKLTRIIKTDLNKNIWHKIAEGSIIEALPDNTYAIDDKNYFVDFSESEGVEPVIRKGKAAGKQELLVNISEGKKELSYKIIW